MNLDSKRMQEYKKEDHEIMVKFLRRREKHFVYPDIPDEETVLIKDVRILKEPKIRRGMHVFETNFICFKTGKILNV